MHLKNNINIMTSLLQDAIAVPGEQELRKEMIE
jgi:hypothetical protein